MTAAAKGGEVLLRPVVLVTGAGRGIGRAITLGFAAAGAAVAVNDIDPTTAEESAAAARGLGVPGVAEAADVSDGVAVRAMVQRVAAALGGIDVLVNNAGIETKAGILEMEEADWDRVVAVNLKGTFLCTQAVARLMVAQGRGGSIVQIASIAGKTPLPHAAHYCAAKAGVIGFTREAARELAPRGIRVNAVCPGVIVTPMTAASRADPEVMRRWRETIPMGRLGEAEEIVGLVRFLASPEAGYITGQAFNVDGGKVMY